MNNNMTDREIMLAIFDKVVEIDKRVENLETKVGSLETKVDNLEIQQKQTQSTIETTVDNCIKALSEGYQANHETIDNLHINSLKSKVTQLELMEQFNRNEIIMLKQKLS